MSFQTSLTSTQNIFLFVMFSLCFSLSSSKNPSNFLKIGSYLSVEDYDSDQLISPDNTFTSGFYSVGDNAYCFAIWFTNSKEKTVVWMANRDKPVNGKGSRISLRKNGAFVLTDVDGSITWQTNTSTSIDVQKAELLDNGNLVLVDSSGKILWQSFDFPTDTLLPHQFFTKNNRLISKLGSKNYATGYYNFYFDNDNVLRLMYNGPDISSVYWPNIDDNVFGNGRTNFNSTRIAVLDDKGRFLSSDWMDFNASDFGFGIKRRLTIDFDGNLRLYSLNNGSRLWTITWEAVTHLCKVHGLCGRNGICVYTPIPKCSCPPGYDMVDTSNWNKGCRPRFNSTCSPSQLKFLKINHVDFYGFDSYRGENTSLESCKKICLENCQCQAFGYSLSGERKCYIKVALFNGFKALYFQSAIYLKLPLSIETSEIFTLNATDFTCNASKPTTMVVGSSSMYQTKGKSLVWVYFYVFASVIGAIEMLFIFSSWWFLFRKHGMPEVVEEGYRVLSSQFRKFTYDELKKATKNFKEELGIGSSGVVCKGVLGDERVVAVKKLGEAYLIEEVFWAEVSTIGKINHMNLVRMWGFCSEPKHRLLVYEFVENQSLDKHLFSDNVVLGWKERFKVALGTAKGLAYLHHECLEWIIHCDVKPENILLDGDFEPKISDFGLAKLSQRGKKNSEFSRIRGTKGYMAPEWALNFPITAKVDVYSYGVVILELVKGIRLSNWVLLDGVEQETELTRFIKLIKGNFQGEEVAWIDGAVDTRLNGQFSRTQAIKLVEIGISCVEEDRSKRPTMDSIVQSLLECED